MNIENQAFVYAENAQIQEFITLILSGTYPQVKSIYDYQRLIKALDHCKDILLKDCRFKLKTKVPNNNKTLNEF